MQRARECVRVRMRMCVYVCAWASLRACWVRSRMRGLLRACAHVPVCACAYACAYASVCA